jgi:hypothetical protein
MATVASYRLPVLSQELPQADSIGQVVDVLGQLNSIVEQVFNKLRAKAELQKDRIDSISMRISSASQKAAVLKKKTDSTVVISPASYPVRTISHYHPVFTPTPEPKVEPLEPIKKRKFGSVEERKEVPLDESFVTQAVQREKYNVKRKEEHQVLGVKSVDELLPFDEVRRQVRKIRKPNKPKTQKDIDPIVWEDFMSKVVKDPAHRYVPVFQNFPTSKLPDHLMDTKIAKDVIFTEKISNDFLSPTMVLNLPDVGISSDVNPNTTIQNDNKTPVQETPVAPVTVEPKPSDISLKSKEPDTTVKIPTPPPIKKEDTHPLKPLISTQDPPLPPPPAVPCPKSQTSEHPEITLTKNEKPLPPPVPSGNSGAPPPPPPPPPVQKPKPPQQPREPRQPKNEPPRQPTPSEDDLQRELLQIILKRRTDISGEKDNKKEDHDEWSD